MRKVLFFEDEDKSWVVEEKRFKEKEDNKNNNHMNNHFAGQSVQILYPRSSKVTHDYHALFFHVHDHVLF